MISIVHVSDLHFRESSNLNGEAEWLLERIWQRFMFANGGPVWLLVTGDVVDNGLSLEFVHAEAGLRRFCGHLLVAPGNHDYGSRGSSYREDSARFFDADFLPALGIAHTFFHRMPQQDVLSDGSGTRALVIGLNSSPTTSSVADFSRGALGADQLVETDALLRVYSALPAVVYLHHRPLPRGRLPELVDADTLLGVTVARKVRVLACGHSGGSGEERLSPLSVGVTRTPSGVQVSCAAGAVPQHKCNVITVAGTSASVETVAL
jgi:3',5'-cyclic AMP phosphodiesterase CpdA